MMSYSAAFILLCISLNNNDNNHDINNNALKFWQHDEGCDEGCEAKTIKRSGVMKPHVQHHMNMQNFFSGL